MFLEKIGISLTERERERRPPITINMTNERTSNNNSSTKARGRAAWSKLLSLVSKNYNSNNNFYTTACSSRCSKLQDEVYAFRANCFTFNFVDSM